MNSIIFELTWDDVHTAINNYVSEKGKLALDCDKDTLTQTYISFHDRDENQVDVESAQVTFKRLL